MLLGGLLLAPASGQAVPQWVGQPEACRRCWLLAVADEWGCGDQRVG